MPEHLSAVDLARLPAAELNSMIRALTAGRTDWPKTALDELTRLQTAYLEADARESALAA